MTGSPDTDGTERYVVAGGRRWRASDPSIPATLRSELVAELMAARRAVAAAGGGEPATGSARRRVQDAKVALGERGRPWWEEPEPESRSARIAATTRALLRHRDAAASTCPSDVARVVGGSTWRSVLDDVRRVASELAAQGQLVVRQRGRVLPDPSAARGPVRYARGDRFPDAPA